MELMTKEHRAQLLANGQAMAKTDISNTVQPVVKLFMPDGAATWLLAWLEPEDIDIAWGLCCLGMGCPEVGPVRLSEIADLRGALGLPVERDRWFKADRSLSDYASAARLAGHIAA